ncbi:ArsR/SmtB family transcription factor [Desulfobaculum bizertense]|uniref:Transcriptional regulator, ArsR family n=1 Tax=Desulfobaculum bizertense DSM 18034 TaxID=1121442 RepID=A0A1T4VZG5_9BACT|nr:metalloregulator ArsR/SmtB family transcription factor [Desulfobaculum bizertense]UIJ37036.1 metalloregulator ArsR/SmtB family transcription factor [Desulfobaculum bizertense]SKA70376.1 transcriptional regulator, ArsR family [Desulfobaculum bizertense DSM 18034]
MKTFLTVMKALSDSNRVKIVKILLERHELCVCELRAALGLAQPTVSKHLKVLEQAGLLMSRKKGPWMNYDINAEATGYAKEMLEQLSNWLNDDEEVIEILKSIQTVDRHEICGK